MVRKYFGTDGIRGRANSVIVPELALRIGQAAGLTFRRGDHRHRVLIGKDTRLSGYMIETALVAGFTSVGMDVFQTGPMPTPAVAMLTRSMRCDLGVMISASHNAYDDNGIKLFGPDGYKLSDAVEHKIEALIDSDLTKVLANSPDLGRAKRIDGVHDRYIEFAKRTLPRALSLDGLRVVVDCANGAAYQVVPEALWELGADVVPIGVEPDGFNINRDCGSTEPAALWLALVADPGSAKSPIISAAIDPLRRLDSDAGKWTRRSTTPGSRLQRKKERIIQTRAVNRLFDAMSWTTSRWSARCGSTPTIRAACFEPPTNCSACSARSARTRKAPKGTAAKCCACSRARKSSSIV